MIAKLKANQYEESIIWHFAGYFEQNMKEYQIKGIDGLRIIKPTFSAFLDRNYLYNIDYII